MVFEFVSLILELFAAFLLVGLTTFSFFKEIKYQNDMDAVVLRLKKNSGI